MRLLVLKQGVWMGRKQTTKTTKRRGGKDGREAGMAYGERVQQAIGPAVVHATDTQKQAPSVTPWTDSLRP